MKNILQFSTGFNLLYAQEYLSLEQEILMMGSQHIEMLTSFAHLKIISCNISVDLTIVSSHL